MPQGEGHTRAAVVASAELLEALADCDQAALFGRLRCPVLLIDGDGDDEERQSLANARRGLPLLPAGSRVELLAGSPHSLEGHLGEAVALLVGWFVRTSRPRSQRRTEPGVEAGPLRPPGRTPSRLTARPLGERGVTRGVRPCTVLPSPS